MKLGGDADGYVLLKKNRGETSFDALSLVKRALGTRRVGHSGTLDKFAEGLLVVLVGRSTRLVPWFTGCDKLYEGTVTFGKETDTLDPEGEVVAEAKAPARELLEAVLPSFVGDMLQAPPAYSSVHIDGKRAHELARAGVEVEMKKRPVSIRSLELLSYDGIEARIRVRCSKGTYIRSLARDIAYATESRAYLSALNRLEVANFHVADAVDPSLVALENRQSALCDALKTIDLRTFASIGVTTAIVGENNARLIANGRPFDPAWYETPLAGDSNDVALFDGAGRFLAVVERRDGAWRYGYVAVRPERL